MSLEDIRKKSLKDYQRLSNTLCVPFKMYVNKVKNCLTHIHKREKVKKKLSIRAYPNPCSGQHMLALIGWFRQAVILCGGTKVQKQQSHCSN